MSQSSSKRLRPPRQNSIRGCRSSAGAEPEPYCFASAARWVWTGDGAGHPSRFVCFRRAFELDGVASDVALAITADSRYELFVNGEWVGHGPPRAWLSPWPVDVYDLRPYLRVGQNLLAVRVQQIGRSTFQYLDADPGLLAQLVIDRSVALVTDRTWRATADPAAAWPVPRVSVQQAWEEQYDARRTPRCGDRPWMEPEFDDAGWPAATVVARPGQGVHERFERRTIPMLTREPLPPARVLGAEVVRPADRTWSLYLDPWLEGDDRSANMLLARGLVATHLFSQRAQALELHQPHGPLPTKLNGEPLIYNHHDLQPTDACVACARLCAGWNTLLLRLPERMHIARLVLNLWHEAPLRFAARPSDEAPPSPWLLLGPFASGDLRWRDPAVRRPQWSAPGATVERLEAIWTRGELTAEHLRAAYAQPAPRTLVAEADAFAVSSSDRPVAAQTPRVEQLAALAHDTPEQTVIHPPVEGSGVRLLLDFGDAVIGFQELALDAPEGTVVDAHNFEFIQRDGRVNLCEGMNNSFRYTCREGVQCWRSSMRRGFRYTWLTFRNFDRPIRLRLARVVRSTYSLTGRGRFACSDERLTRIWQVGAQSLRCCAEDTYTDCPTYEQVHWVGDARNEALVDLVTSGDPRLSAHCWLQAARSLQRSPLVESHVPSGWQNLLPAWSFLWMRWAQEHYELTGDEAFAHAALPWLDRNVAGLEAHLNGRGLFEITAWNLFDWAPMDTPDAGVVTHQNCLAVLGLRQAAQLAQAVGNRERPRRWRRLADRLSRAINQSLWHQNRAAYVDAIHSDGRVSSVFSQQTQTAAYIAGIATGERAQRCRQVMAKSPRGFVKAGSPFFMFFALEGLVREGRWRELIKTIRGYWGAQLDAGATTFWEMYHAESQRHTRSHCHGWSAAPTYFLSRYVLGVHPAKAGYAALRIAPRPGGLRWAHGTVPTPRGDVECHWRVRGSGFELDARLPQGVPATLALPVTGALAVQEGQLRRLKGPGEATRLSAPRGGRVRLTVGCR